MLAWDVSVGAGWRSSAVTAPQPCLIRLYPESTNELLNAFSRSIAFVPRPDGTLDVEAEVFNNGLSSAQRVACEFFDVSAYFAGQWPAEVKPLTESAPSLGRAELAGELKPVERRKLTLPGQRLAAKPVYIAVKLLMGAMTAGIYWGVYPADRFFDQSVRT